jgi:hypothetical protein
MLADLTGAIAFIKKLEQTYPTATTYEVVNRLRGHTKPAYTTRFWSIATGFSQTFVLPNLDGTIALVGESTDFGHLIAALADQVNQPGVKLSDLTQWTADHTSWAGDLGSSIVTYCRQPEKFPSVLGAFDRFASSSDLAADIAAYVIGQELNKTPTLTVSAAIEQYATATYSEHVRSFMAGRFGGVEPEREIRRQVLAYLNLASDSGLFGWAKGLLKGRLAARHAYSEVEINQAIEYFMNYLNQKNS